MKDRDADGAGPLLSVILATDSYRTIRPVIARLREQSLCARIEIVVVLPAGHPRDLDPAALEGFAAVRCVEVPAVKPLGGARAAGIRAATAPVVVVGETHSFPCAGWAEALLEAHQGPWAVVIPAFLNANAESPLSWAAFLRDYGVWMEGLPARPAELVPPYNTAVKREVLLGFGDRLERMISQGDELAAALRAGGHRAFFEPAARIEHANVSRPGAWFAQRFIVGRLLGAVRASRWSWPRRILYLCGSPLIPAVILARLRECVGQARRTGALPAGSLPALTLCAVVCAAGEAVSYLFGGGPDLVLRCDEYELFKLRYTALPAP